MRVTFVAAVAAVLAATPTAVAAPPKPPAPWCLAISDARTDAPASTALDVLSAEAGAGRTEVSVVLRVAATDTSGDAARLLGGYRWSVRLRADGIEYTFDYLHDSALGGGRTSSEVRAANQPLPHVIAVGSNQILWKVKRADLPKPGPRSAWVEMDASTRSFGGTADTATGRVRRSTCG